MATVDNWNEISAHGWPILLTGNGFSVNTDAVFIYTRLFDFAKTAAILTDEEIEIFDSFNTTNFEEVLDRLNTAKLILRSLDYTEISDELEAKYDLIRDSLIKCVNRLHPSFTTHQERIEALNLHLNNYQKIFTTNYDLLLYWSIMQNENHFADYFWNPNSAFDERNTFYRGEDRRCHIHYLHGALHLYRDNANVVHKIIATGGQGLLDSIRTSITARKLPLFISEGDYKKKLHNIRSSEYLNFCLDQLSKVQQNIVIFGHSLDTTFDKHILDSLKTAYHRARSLGIDFRIAVSIHEGNQDLADHVELNLNQFLSRDIQKHFFTAATHPISLVGRPTLAT